VNPAIHDSINLGRISLSDIIGDVDFQFVLPQGHGITAYLGTGVSIHLRNGSGAAINGTFMEDALDVITAGLNGTMGFEFKSLARMAIQHRWARRVVEWSEDPASLRTGIMYRFRGPGEQGAATK